MLVCFSKQLEVHASACFVLKGQTNSSTQLSSLGPYNCNNPRQMATGPLKFTKILVQVMGLRQFTSSQIMTVKEAAVDCAT